MANPAMLLPPGFRFHPTDEELILHYLRNRAASIPCPVSIIAEVDIYKFDPWELPAKAMFGDREWYFFSPRDRKYPNGYRPNRAAASGYWKATGTDKPILADKGSGVSIGVKKALVFYQGRPPRGVKTEWIMHEYRLAEAGHKNDYKPKKLRDSSMRLDDWVLCRIYKKGSHQSSMDAEKEDSASGVEDAFISTPPSSNTQADNLLKLPKSYSLTELLDAADYSTLSRMLEHPSDALDIESNLLGFPTFNQSFISTNCLVQPQAEPIALKTENNLKRQWTGNECFEPGSEILPAAKRATGSRLATNLMNQQLISNSHLYFQYPR